MSGAHTVPPADGTRAASAADDTGALSLASFTPPLPLPQAVFNAAQDTLCQARRTLNAEGGGEKKEKEEKKNTGCLQAREK